MIYKTVFAIFAVILACSSAVNALPDTNSSLQSKDTNIYADDISFIDLVATNKVEGSIENNIDKLLDEAETDLSGSPTTGPADVKGSDLIKYEKEMTDITSSGHTSVDSTDVNISSEVSTGATDNVSNRMLDLLNTNKITKSNSDDIDEMLKKAKEEAKEPAPAYSTPLDVVSYPTNQNVVEVKHSDILQYQSSMMYAITSLNVKTGFESTQAFLKITGAAPDRIDTNIYASLRDCIALGLQNNLGLTIDRYNPAVQWEGIRLERSVFDPQFHGLIQWSETKAPRPYKKYFITGDSRLVVGNRETERTEFSGDISGKFITGLRYSIGMGMDRMFNDPGGIDGWSAQHSTYVAGSIDVPLLKGFGIGVNLAPMRIQRNNWRISRVQLDEMVQNLTTDINNFYWILYFTREDASAKEYTLELAEELLKINTAKVQVGMAAPIEITQAKANIAIQEEALIVAQNNILNAEDNLRQIINFKMDDLLRPKALKSLEYHIVPTEKPQVETVSFDENLCIKQALDHRQTLEIAGLQLRNANENMKIAKNNLLPEFNVKAGLGYDGLGGNYGNALDDQFTGSHPEWSVGLELSFPLFYNEPVATYRQAKYNKKQSELNIQQVKHQIAIQVRTALRGVVTDRKRIHTTKEGTKEAKEQLRAEQEKFNVGQSTTFLVLQYQDDLATALSSEIRAMADWKISLAELYRQTAQTLPISNIKIDDFYSLPDSESPGIPGWIWSEGPR